MLTTDRVEPEISALTAVPVDAGMSFDSGSPGDPVARDNESRADEPFGGVGTASSAGFDAGPDTGGDASLVTGSEEFDADALLADAVGAPASDDSTFDADALLADAVGAPASGFDPDALLAQALMADGETSHVPAPEAFDPNALLADDPESPQGGPEQFDPNALLMGEPAATGPAEATFDTGALSSDASMTPPVAEERFDPDALLAEQSPSGPSGATGLPTPAQPQAPARPTPAESATETSEASNAGKIVGIVAVVLLALVLVAFGLVRLFGGTDEAPADLSSVPEPALTSPPSADPTPSDDTEEEPGLILPYTADVESGTTLEPVEPAPSGGTSSAAEGIEPGVSPAPGASDAVIAPRASE